MITLLGVIALQDSLYILYPDHQFTNSCGIGSSILPYQFMVTLVYISILIYGGLRAKVSYPYILYHWS